MASPAGGQEVYKWKDARGQWHFSQGPGSSRQQVAAPAGEAAQMIAQRCEREWPDDFRMQKFCRERQLAGLRDLAQPRPNDISDAEFQTIRNKCIGQWGDDFRMIAFCERRQTEALRSLR